jgi:hypothetical protein
MKSITIDKYISLEHKIFMLNEIERQKGTKFINSKGVQIIYYI